MWVKIFCLLIVYFYTNTIGTSIYIICVYIHLTQDCMLIHKSNRKVRICRLMYRYENRTVIWDLRHSNRNTIFLSNIYSFCDLIDMCNVFKPSLYCTIMILYSVNIIIILITLFADQIFRLRVPRPVFIIHRTFWL